MINRSSPVQKRPAGRKMVSNLNHAHFRFFVITIIIYSLIIAFARNFSKFEDIYDKGLRFLCLATLSVASWRAPHK